MGEACSCTHAPHCNPHVAHLCPRSIRGVALLVVMMLGGLFITACDVVVLPAAYFYDTTLRLVHE
jgi:hypothetical protein